MIRTKRAFEVKQKAFFIIFKVFSVARNCVRHQRLAFKDQIMSTLTTISHKIFETNSSFYVKNRTTGKVQFLFFRRLLLVLTKSSFHEKTND